MILSVKEAWIWLFKFCIYHKISYLVISIFGSPSPFQHVCSFKVQTAKRFVFPNAMQARRWWILDPQKKTMIELNFAISNNFAKTSHLYIQWKIETPEKNPAALLTMPIISTLNNLRCQLMMPDLTDIVKIII